MVRIDSQTLIKHFKSSGSFVATLNLPGGKKSVVMARVRNTNMVKPGVFQVGCEIEKLDPLGELHYAEYLEDLHSSG